MTWPDAGAHRQLATCRLTARLSAPTLDRNHMLCFSDFSMRGPARRLFLGPSLVSLIAVYCAPEAILALKRYGVFIF